MPVGNVLSEFKDQLMPIEETAVWRKSSRSSDGDLGCCVELAALGTVRAIRDSKNPAGPRLNMSLAGLAGFIKGIKHDAYEV
jgi:uncharacterized protein DUF397